MRFVLRLTEEDGREEGLLSDDDRAFEQIQHDFRDALVHVVLLVDRDDGSDLQDTCQVAMWLRVPGGKRVGLKVDGKDGAVGQKFGYPVFEGCLEICRKNGTMMGQTLGLGTARKLLLQAEVE